MNSKDEYTNFNPGESLDMAALRKACEGILKVRDFVPLHPKAVLHMLDMLKAAQKDQARYQWLREECTASQWSDISAPHSRMLLIGPALDSAIDAAMAATKGEEA